MYTPPKVDKKEIYFRGSILCYTKQNRNMGGYMKIERLIGILSVLLQQDKVTAPYLAEKFEVSRRTINRDIESLCIAGIPIATERGIHGGISIMSGYKIDKTLFTSKEMQAMLSGLKSLDSISGENRYKLLMDKLSPGSADNYLKHLY